MLAATLLLILLIITAPLCMILDGPIIQGLIMAVAAISMGIIALQIRPAEARFLTFVASPVLIAAFVPAVWILAQVLPVRTLGLANSIWDTAAAALQRPLNESISIDPGETLISLTRYLSMGMIAFVAAAAAVERRRAEWLLIALTAAPVLVALTVLVTGGDRFLQQGSRADFAATDTLGLGIILAVGSALLTSERSRAQPSDQRSMPSRYSLVFVICFIATAICAVAFIEGATGQAYFALACGIITILIAVAARRFSFGPWGYSAVIAVSVVTVVAAIALQPKIRTLDLTLSFAAHAPAKLIAVTQRILMETTWTGTGAGTFAGLLPIYRDIDEFTPGVNAPTAAAAIAIEMGRPFFWVCLLAAVSLVAMLLRGALLRRRDSVYSIVGASCVVTTTLLAFGNSGLFSSLFLIIIAATVGIAIAQTKSRST